MPDSLIKPVGGLSTSVQAQVGSGTYQVGDAPMSLKQKAKEAQLNMRTRVNAKVPQKISSYSPGQNVPGKPSIKGRTSFSDERGD